MNDFVEGDVVICSTSQAGTVIQKNGQEIWVLLRNGNIWTGPIHKVRLPQDQADLDACPLEVERVEVVVPLKPKKRMELD